MNNLSPLSYFPLVEIQMSLVWGKKLILCSTSEVNIEASALTLPKSFTQTYTKLHHSIIPDSIQTLLVFRFKPQKSTLKGLDQQAQGMQAKLVHPNITKVHKKNVSKQGRKIAKGESSVKRDLLFDVIPEDKIDHMETENAQSEGRTKEKMDEDKKFDEVGLSTEDEVSTDFEKVSTDKPKVSTDGSKVVKP
ncbi:hypothetical protein Tco_1112404 [Tanacetum coccineum]|uniref:Uncharacterized protein n=1 Tax=Tanacetum coccineum TaxID=301880 RepID=A0ABQ5IPB2_9ASTR